ncbi:MAG: nucleoside triphosphate pyrophosphohydrolase [Armatimonadota bacterium]|nr:nucleoside triphosphate pyrophosphohydrolase [Armatimonadota bacterium]
MMPEQPTPAAAFERLVQIIARLRAPDGCPWDREQTHVSLRTHLLEEACETMDAIDRGSDAHLREELGDLLMQPILHAQIAAEEQRFDIVDVLEGISDKLVRRHPHVFGDINVADATEVLRNWDAIKRAEKAEKAAANESPHPASILDDVPRTLPALALALEVSKKAVKVGFEWPDIAGVLDKLREETEELETALQDVSETRERIAEELGDLLFTAVNVARWKGINPELALRDTVRRFSERFQTMERYARQHGLELEKLTPEQWDAMWEEAKVESREFRVGKSLPE